LARPLAVLNLGGVGNVTWIGEGDQPPVAFDTGPGNALIDDWMGRRRGMAMDADGALARSGRINQAALDALLGHDYFRKPAPKSLDRDAFSLEPVNGLDDGDGAATLVAFTAASVAMARDWMPAPPKRWLVCGGGRRNRAIMEALTRGLGVAVDPVEAVGWDGDALEAQAFAFLAVRGARGLPLTWPTTTGAPRPLTGGTYWPAATVLGASAVAR
ncbi:anhydro-N-acetylmuramic acid kinase, partial [Rhodospirillum rubrum]